VSERHAVGTSRREVAVARAVQSSPSMLTEWDEEPTHEYPSLTRSRVLVAEDDPELRELVADRLRREGCEVITVGTGGEALDRIAKAEPSTELDLAILDVRMPGMSGLEVVYLVRTWDLAIPLLLVTAFPEPELIEECDRLRVPILQKPFPLYRIGSVARTAMRGAEW
jgi:CheY-like chemotaxis protein